MFEIRPYWNRDDKKNQYITLNIKFEIRPYWNRDFQCPNFFVYWWGGLKSDHIGIETFVGNCNISLVLGLKSDHIGIETVNNVGDYVLAYAFEIRPYWNRDMLLTFQKLFSLFLCLKSDHIGIETLL